MSISYDHKEDLRLRMADLEKKLAESEEERSKLEKTCNVLMRAFREEEKMQYKALNKKYEKFLEDCSVRKRRNDIILRSLCRIEDRSRALFAKTERLKLLKDRYVSYLKRRDPKKEETFSQSFPLPEKPDGAGSKSLQWKTPVATHWEAERFREVGKDLLLGRKSPRMTSEDLLARVTEGNFQKFEREKSEVKQTQEGRKPSEVNVYNGISNFGGSASGRTELNPVKSGFVHNDRQANPLPKQFESEKLTPNQIKPEYRVSDNYGSNKKEETSEKKVTGRHESVEKVKKALSDNWVKNDEGHDPYDDNQSGKSPTTTPNKSNPAFLPGIDYGRVTSTPDIAYEENHSENNEFDTKSDSKDHHEGLDISENESKPLPMGLDGVDYQNETYPESYYEQPVHHHNHTSIASDVILEEDETEQELDEEAEDPTPDHSHREPGGAGDGHEPWASSPGHDEPRRGTNKEADEGRDVDEQSFHEVKSQQSRSEKSSEGKQSEGSEKSEKLGADRSDKNKIGKSNLFHLLESDSESFQIEHGDVISGNEDSDFDFSFHQN